MISSLVVEAGTVVGSIKPSVDVSKGACSTCHEINGRGLLGPDLSSAGMRKEERLRNKILDPDHRHASSTVIARTRDGREIRGVARNEDTYWLQIVDISGQLHTLDKHKLAQIRKEEKPLMPVDAAKLTFSSCGASAIALPR